MKLSFSTLGCPDWTWQEITSAAKDLGYDGIELRGIGRDIFMPDAKIFQPQNIEQTMKQLQDLNLEISCLSAGVRLNERYQIEQHIENGKDYVDLAQQIGVKYLRILADAAPEPLNDLDVNEIAESLTILAVYAQQKGVEILVETNGYFAKTEHMLELLEKVNNPAVKVLWDVHHPFRYYHEPVAETYAALKPYIKYLHIKDSVMNADGKVEYKMMGYGDLPIQEVVELLKADNFDGYVCLEWLKRWCHHLEEGGLIFPHYVNYMRRLLK